MRCIALVVASARAFERDVDGGEARRTSGRQSERAHRHARHLPCLRVRQHFQVDKIYFPLRAVARSLTSVGLIPKREAR